MIDHDPESSAAREGQYLRAASWAEDRQAMRRNALRFSRIVAGVAVVIALCEALALIVLMPLKTVVPYTILVDRQTGYVQSLKGLETQPLTTDAALTQSLLAQYVIAREQFDITDIAQQYHKVALWSDGPARQDYLAVMPHTNPASPFRRYPRTTRVTVTIKSVSPLDAQAALVRFQSERRDQGAALGVVDAWAAVIRYRFSGAPMSLDNRLLNPLGFQVVSYRRDQEAPPITKMPAPTEIARP